MAKQKINVKLLRKVQKHILEEPKRLVMAHITRHGNEGTVIRACVNEFNAGNQYEKVQRFAECGTAACIMGWARILGKQSGLDEYDLGVSFDKLCSASSWPRKFATRYAKAKAARTRARIAAARIEHYLKTNGAE